MKNYSELIQFFQNDNLASAADTLQQMNENEQIRTVNFLNRLEKYSALSGEPIQFSLSWARRMESRFNLDGDEDFDGTTLNELLG